MPFAATVTRTGDGFAVDVENLSDAPIRVGCVLLEDVYLHLGPVPARSKAQFDGRAHPFNPWGTDRRQPNRGRDFEEMMSRPVPRYPSMLREEARHAFLAQGCFERTLAMHAYLSQGAALVCVEFEDAAAPFGIKDRTYEVNHIQLARQIVFPQAGI
jgi:hypothetical protein